MILDVVTAAVCSGMDCDAIVILTACDIGTWEPFAGMVNVWWLSGLIL